MRRPKRAFAFLLGVSCASALAVSAGPAGAIERPDAWITLKTKTALLLDDGVSGDIDVDTRDGRVTLHGSVPSDAARAAAERVARGIEGARAVRNQLDVRPGDSPKATAVGREDAGIRSELERRLEEDAGLADSNIEIVSVEKGVVVLGGTARTYGDHYDALRLARSVDGVVRVRSEVETPETFDDAEYHPLEDAWKATRETAGEASRAVRGAAKDVARETEDAARAAARGSGEVGTTARDLWITSVIKLALLANPDVSGFDVNVDTHDGVVKLFGVIQSAAAREAAGDAARSVEGVRKVENDLEIVPRGERKEIVRKDEQLREDLAKAFESRDGFEDARIRFEVANGVVRLKGTASSRSQVLAAATAARSVEGVRAVRTEDVEVRRSS